MPGNSNLHDSIRNKQDEFYTEIGMIEQELKHYKNHFKGKTVLCNCDDPYESNFFKYFCLNFNELELKKLICTCYEGSYVSGVQLSLFDDQEIPIDKGQAYKIEINSINDMDGDGSISLKDVEILLHNKKTAPKKLKGTGDFRSDECIKLLKEADIVVTNPPFSLFREYVAQLVNYDKKFLIIGNLNNITYNEIMPLIKNNKIWIGNNCGHYWFKVPDYYEEKPTDFKIDETGQKWRRMGNICWYTNMDFEERHKEMTLFKFYSPEDYPTYENYDAIEVSNTRDIPVDYFGVMGVPITFISKYSPEQFEILGIDKDLTNDGKRGTINGKSKYARLFIKRRNSQ